MGLRSPGGHPPEGRDGWTMDDKKKPQKRGSQEKKPEDEQAQDPHWDGSGD